MTQQGRHSGRSKAVTIFGPASPEPARPHGLVERLPLAAPPTPAAAYRPADGAAVQGDRRRRRRAKGEPWRGRLVDTIG